MLNRTTNNIIVSPITSNLMHTFVREHAKDDVDALRLKYSGKTLEFSLDFALIQIEARKKTRKKISEFISHDDFIFPSLIAAEQATNQTIAKYHSSLLTYGSSVLDLTAGLGIDDMTFAGNGINVTACEIDELKCLVLQHNATVMGVDRNLKVINTDSIDYIRNHSDRFDAVFADPARRDSTGGKVHALADCQPDILSVLSDIQNITDRVLIKCSPLLDLTFIRDTVSDLSHIHTVCFRGECKEVLIEIRKNAVFTGVSVVDLDTDAIISSFQTNFSPIKNRDDITYASNKSPMDYTYLYEPNSGVMKTGDWITLLSSFPDLNKVDINTHLFLSDTIYHTFPGRVTKIDKEFDKKALKTIKGEKLNVVSRNHPLSSPLIYKKYNITPGSDSFLYAFRYKGMPSFVRTSAITLTDM